MDESEALKRYFRGSFFEGALGAIPQQKEQPPEGFALTSPLLFINLAHLTPCWPQSGACKVSTVTPLTNKTGVQRCCLSNFKKVLHNSFRFEDERATARPGRGILAMEVLYLSHTVDHVSQIRANREKAYAIHRCKV